MPERMDWKEFSRILDSLDGSPEQAVSLLSGIPTEELGKYGGVCSCSQDLKEAEAYISQLEQQIVELRDRGM